MATRARNLGTFMLITCLINLHFEGTAVFASSLKCAFKFVPASDCVTANCVDDCNDFNFWAIEILQFVPFMLHLCSEDTCHCSVQSEQIWSKGKGVIVSYVAPEGGGLEIPPDEGQEYKYEECVNLCIGFGFKDQVDFGDETGAEDLWFHVVAKGNCYCKAKPVFGDMSSDAPNDLLPYLPVQNYDDNQFKDASEDEDYDDDYADDLLDDIPVDYIEGSEYDPLVQQQQQQQRRRKRKKRRLNKKQRAVDIMPPLEEEEEPEDDDSDDKSNNKRKKIMSPSP